MTRYFDLTGTEIGHWRVLKRAPNHRRKTYWVCQCVCGTLKDVFATSLTSGRSRSCGCRGGASFSKNIAYGSWLHMRERCYNQSSTNYKYYGARGVSVCARWDDFLLFLEDMGPRPSTAHSLDRIDQDGNYEPCNCRWATAYVQSNNRRNNVVILVDGARMTFAQAAAKFGVPYGKSLYRFHTGVDIAEIFGAPAATFANGSEAAP